MAVVGGEWRNSRFSACDKAFLRYFFTLKPLPTNTFTKIFYGKNTIKSVGSNTSPTPKKWRWLAVVGGKHVFYTILKLLKSAVPSYGISLAVRCSGCSKGHPEPRPQGSLNPNLGTEDITSCCRLFSHQPIARSSYDKSKIPVCIPAAPFRGIR
jgi:hypothetical protein